MGNDASLNLLNLENFFFIKNIFRTLWSHCSRRSTIDNTICNWNFSSKYL